MTDMYFLVLTAINLFALAFMCVLVSLNDTLNPKQTRGFLYTFLVIALSSSLVRSSQPVSCVMRTQH